MVGSTTRGPERPVARKCGERRQTSMSSPPQRPAARARVSSARGALFSTLVHLWPYIWPSDRRDLKLRVLGAFVLLLAAKAATMTVPFTYKWATDALAGEPSVPA